jgi:CheY-like chemotaxis protein
VPTILIADDNSNIQKMVALAFKDEGIDVVAVGNGEAAVRKAAEIMPDLVLADIFMPVRNGYEVCEYIKQDSKLSHIPVVLLVGAFDPFNEREAQRVSADGVLKKPFVPPDPLVGIVKSLLAKNSVAQLVPVAASTPEPAKAVVSQPMPFSPPPQEPRFEAPAPQEAEIEEETPVADFSLPPAEISSIPEGGADAFGSMLDTSPLGTMRPPMRPRAEQNHSQTQHTDSSIGFAPGMGVAIPEDRASHVAEEKSSPEDSAQFPPLRDQIVRDWGARSPLPSHSEEEPAGEFGTKPGVEDWRSSFPVSASREAEILHPTEPALAPWRDFKFAPEITAARFAEDEVEPSGHAGAEDDSARVADSAIETKHEASAPVETGTEIDAPSSVESASTDDASTPATSWEASSTTVEEEQARVSEVTETSPAWQDVSNEVNETGASESTSESSAAAEEDVPAEFAAHDSFTYPAVDPEAALPAPSSFDAARIVDFPAISEARDSAGVESYAAHSEVEQSEPAHAEPAHSELMAVAESSVAAESLSLRVGEAADPRVVEEIVARVVERMQPQILEIVTREVLRPVVEALVRKQLEQK